MTNDKSELERILEGVEELEIENFDIEAEELEFELLPQAIYKAITKANTTTRKTEEIKKFNFVPLKDQYHGKIAELILGATKNEGGTRDYSLKIGGETVPPFYFFEGSPVNRPVIAHDIFDMAIGLPSNLKQFYEDVMDDPVEWAKKQVSEFNAEVITLHLVSTDPNLKNTSPEDSAVIVEDVLRAVKVPLIISGSGNSEKDSDVLVKAAEAASGEKCILSAASPSMDYKKIAKSAIEHKHNVLSLVSMDPAGMKQMNKNLIREGLGADRIVMDPVTGALGYGIEYTISTMERIRLSALKGDKDLAMPILSGASNSWSAREAWLEDQNLGPREYRGPLWEAITATTALLSGADIFMMIHPGAIKTVKSLMDSVFNKSDEKNPDYEDWLRI